MMGLIIFGIVCGVIAVTSISYSIVAVTYDIKSGFYASAAKWSIVFDNLSEANIIGDAEEVNKPYINENTTNIDNINVKLNSMDSEVYYIFDVTNNGIFDAKISSINIPKPKCTGTNKDSKLVCDYIKYELLYSNGDNLNIGDVLYADQTKQLKLRVYYSGDKLPVYDVIVENLTASIVYIQN